MVAELKIDPEAVAAIERQLLEECRPSQPVSRVSEADASARPETQEALDQPSEANEGDPRQPSTSANAPAVDALLRAERKLQDFLSSFLPSQAFYISLNGVESGDIEAVVRASDSSQVRV